jgi:5-methylthioadenosine/S-adenosylhomocysteine deaminase
VALAPDWTPSGSPALLGELKVAAKYSREQLGGFLTNKSLAEMVTSTAAEVLALDKVVGKLEAGYLGDVLVLRGTQGDAYDALVASRPEDVALVTVSGRLRYGDPALMDAVVQPRCEAMMMCGAEKRLCVPDSEDPKDALNQDLATIRAAIQTFYATPYKLEICEQ